MNEIVEVWVGKRTDKEVLEEVSAHIIVGNYVELHFGVEYPRYEILKGIAEFWKSKKLTIHVWGDTEFKKAIKTLKELTYG